MDSFDRKILSALQADGRLTITELADRVGLSLSPCHRRLRRLEQDGLIAGYHARLAAPKLGLNFSAIVFATVRSSQHDELESFEQALLRVPEVVTAQRLFGDPDYMLHIVCADLGSFQRLYDDRLATMPNVQKLTSTLVMKDVIRNGLLPL